MELSVDQELVVLSAEVGESDALRMAQQPGGVVVEGFCIVIGVEIVDQYRNVETSALGAEAFAFGALHHGRIRR